MGVKEKWKTFRPGGKRKEGGMMKKWVIRKFRKQRTKQKTLPQQRIAGPPSKSRGGIADHPWRQTARNGPGERPERERGLPHTHRALRGCIPMRSLKRSRKGNGRGRRCHEFRNPRSFPPRDPASFWGHLRISSGTPVPPDSARPDGPASTRQNWRSALPSQTESNPPRQPPKTGSSRFRAGPTEAKSGQEGRKRGPWERRGFWNQHSPPPGEVDGAYFMPMYLGVHCPLEVWVRELQSRRWRRISIFIFTTHKVELSGWAGGRGRDGWIGCTDHRFRPEYGAPTFVSGPPWVGLPY